MTENIKGKFTKSRNPVFAPSHRKHYMVMYDSKITKMYDCKDAMGFISKLELWLFQFRFHMVPSTLGPSKYCAAENTWKSFGVQGRPYKETSLKTNSEFALCSEDCLILLTPKAKMHGWLVAVYICMEFSLYHTSISWYCKHCDRKLTNTSI